MMGGNEEIAKNIDLQQVENRIRVKEEQTDCLIENKIFPLSKIKKLLKYKDVRSVIAWCRKNGVFVIQQGNAHFVNRTQFALAFFKPFVEYLKNNFENWNERFTDYIGVNYAGLLESSEKRPAKKGQISDYIPESNIEKCFLKKIKSL